MQKLTVHSPLSKYPTPAYPSLSQIVSHRTLTSYAVSIHLNVIHLLMSKISFPILQGSLKASVVGTCMLHYTSHPALFHHPNYVWLKLQNYFLPF